MKVEVDSGSGFCFGVENAVEIAENAIESGEQVFCLGPIVHNDIEVERLKKKGLITIDREEYNALRDSKVLIRAHGEPPATYETARKNNLTIIEATCPIVKRLQTRIRDAWAITRDVHGQVVIFGKAGHAEVVGLLGHTENQAIVVNSISDIEKIDFSKPVQLFSQTTMRLKDYSELADLIRKRIEEAGLKGSSGGKLTVNNTICGQVSNREPRLREFARTHDIVVFVTGQESSNGRMLFGVCFEENPDTYMISSPGELKKEWFSGKLNAGICGATSTPKWLIDNVAKSIREFASYH
jgi:4-hydroxy-3-methylbut-2-en-1-yl diphosphate reductase